MTDPSPQHQCARAEQRLETILSRGLTAGVALSALVTLIGAVMYLLTHTRDPVALSEFVSQPEGVRSIPAIIRGVLGLGGQPTDPRAVIQLGVVLLIATPIARVVFSLLVFAYQRDRLYVAISAAVLGFLLLGFLGITH